MPGPAGEVVAGGELVHGDHGGAGLLAPQLQHREQVQRHRAHVGQGPHLRQQQLLGVNQRDHKLRFMLEEKYHLEFV